MIGFVIFYFVIFVNDIVKIKEFYCDCLGVKVGREIDKVIILDFYGY